MALEMKTQCETCECALEAEDDACICSYECTFCTDCSLEQHQLVCPNCGGELSPRPKRHTKH